MEEELKKVRIKTYKGYLLAEKAYVINNINFDEPWYCPDKIFYSTTVGKAKLLALNEIRYDGFTDKYTDQDISFLNIRMKRDFDNDKYIVDGILKTKNSIDYDQQVNERKIKYQKIVADNPNGKAYILKRGSYYMSGWCGYTDYKHKAGIYDVAEAARHVMSCSLRDNMHMVLIDPVEHNEMILKEIEALKTRLV